MRINGEQFSVKGYIVSIPFAIEGGGGQTHFNIFLRGRDGGLKDLFWRAAWWERGGQFLEGGSEFLEIAITNFTWRLLFDLLFTGKSEKCCITCYFSLMFLAYLVFLTAFQ